MELNLVELQGRHADGGDYWEILHRPGAGAQTDGEHVGTAIKGEDWIEVRAEIVAVLDPEAHRLRDLDSSLVWQASGASMVMRYSPYPAPTAG